MQQSPSTRAAMFPGVGRLRFADDLEPSFAEYHAEHSLPFARFGLVLALMLYALFGVLDLYVAPGVAQWIWLIRYAVFCPVALIVFGLTFTHRFSHIMQPALAAVATVAGLGIVAMIAIARPQAGYLYYAGLLLVVPWVYTVLQLRFAYAAKACLAIMIGYEAVAVWLKPTPPEILVNNNFFFLGRHPRRGRRVHDRARPADGLPPAPRHRGAGGRARRPQRCGRCAAACAWSRRRVRAPG